MSNDDDVLIVKGMVFEEYQDKEDSKYKLFLKLLNYQENESNIVSVLEFKDEYISLKFGNGASWCRMDSTFSKKYKYVLRKANGKLSFSWNIEDENEYNKVKDDFKYLDIKKIKGNPTTHIKIYGKKNIDIKNTREIRNDIREYFKNYLCIVCGNSDIEIDHKNGLYNDIRVLNIKTQCIDDFQPLCRHCNQQKRQSIIYTKKNGKRYKASNIPQLKIFGVDFIEGNEDFDINNINAMVGTYWYDPIKFMNHIKMI
jgi:hypothetical protein